jgi:hypothetical protein
VFCPASAEAERAPERPVAASRSVLVEVCAPTVLKPDAASSTLARLRVDAGEPGVRLV